MTSLPAPNPNPTAASTLPHSAPPAESTPRPIVVLGAGIIGLTTAIRLLESPLAQRHPIHIIADHFPLDPLDPKYASSAAGAHHLSFAADEDKRQRRWDRRTFAVMYDEWRAEGERTGLMVIKQTEYMSEGKHLKIYEEHPDFIEHDPAHLPPGTAHSVSFTSLTMTPLTYLAHLLERFDLLTAQLPFPRDAGRPRMHRFHLDALASLSSPPVLALIHEPPVAVVNCTALGALFLGGVADQAMHPVRGHVLKVKAPWIREGYTRQIGSLAGAEGGERTYVIPRPDGEVVLGGTRGKGDWDPYPRADDRRDILRRVTEVCPALIPAHLGAKPLKSNEEGGVEVEEMARLQLCTTTGDGAALRKEGEKGGWHPLEELVTGEVVGFRPQRDGGTRLERGEDVALRSATYESSATAVVVHNYGHGGAGWQSCWGCAEDAARTLVAALL